MADPFLLYIIPVSIIGMAFSETVDKGDFLSERLTPPKGNLLHNGGIFYHCSSLEGGDSSAQLSPKNDTGTKEQSIQTDCTLFLDEDDKTDMAIKYYPGKSYGRR